MQGLEIEQAATAVNQMTAAVDEVARNAVSTSEASRQSEQTAQRGREQVQETVVSIGALADGVTDTSQRIEQLAGRFNGGVEGQQIGLLGDAANHVQHLADVLHPARQLFDTQ